MSASMIEKYNRSIQCKKAVGNFRKAMQRKLRDKKFDPFHLKSRIELQKYQEMPGEMSRVEDLHEDYFIDEAHTKMVQSYSEFMNQIQLLNSMIAET